MIEVKGDKKVSTIKLNRLKTSQNKPKQEIKTKHQNKIKTTKTQAKQSEVKVGRKKNIIKNEGSKIKINCYLL